LILKQDDLSVLLKLHFKNVRNLVDLTRVN